jgi:hypothetical protein
MAKTTKRDTWKPTPHADRTSNLGSQRDISAKIEAAQRADLHRTGSGAARKMGSGGAKGGKC